MFVNLRPQPTADLFSLASAAAQLRVPLATLERVAVELRLQPALRINGAPFMAADQIERIAAHLQANPTT